MIRFNKNRSKYNTSKICVDGIIFDSKDEITRYYELTFMLKANKIRDLKYHEQFELIPAQYETVERYGKNGKRLKDGLKLVEHAAVYTADFTYIDCATGEKIVEDVKCKKTKTEAYVLRRKMMYQKYKIRIKEIEYGRN